MDSIALGDMRRTGWYVAAFFGAAAGTTAQAQQSPAETASLAELDPEVVAVMARVTAASPAIGALWTGFWSPPEFIIHRSRHVALLYSQSGPRPGFVKVRVDDRYRSLSPHTYVILGTRPKRVRRLQRGEPFVPYALDLAAPFDSSANVLSQADRLVHESFHRWQVNAFSERPATTCIPQWYPRYMAFSPDFRAAIQRELALLQVAVRASSEPTMRDASAEYLLARKQRLSAVDALVFHIEQWQERAEGTARYVGNAAHLLVEYATLESLPEVLANALDRQIAHAGNPRVTAAREQAGRSYSAGAAVTFLNSRLAASGWHSAVREGRALDEVLAEAVGLGGYLSWVTSLPRAPEVCQHQHSK